MAHRRLGITWNDERVNVGVVEASFRRFELTGLYSLARETEDGSRLTVAQAIERSPIGKITPADTIVVAFPGHKVMYETMELPFREPRRVNAALPFQMMDAIPVPVDQLLVDYHVLEYKGKGMRVLAAAAAKKGVADFLEAAAQEGLDPAVVIPEGFETAVIGRTMQLQGTNMAVLVEGNHMEMALFRDHVMVNVRVVELEQAHETDQEPSSELLREVMLFAAAVSDFTGHNLDGIYLMGDAGEPMRDAVAQTVGVHATVLRPDDMEFFAGVEEVPESQSVMRAMLLAAFPEVMSLRDTVNLRKGGFASAAQYSLLKGKLKLVVATALTFFVLLGVRSYLHYNTLKMRYDAEVAQVRQLSKALLDKEYEDPDKVLGMMKHQISYKLNVMPRCPVHKVMGKVFQGIVDAGMASQDSIQIGSDQGIPFAIEIESLRMDETQGYVRCQSDTIETMEQFIEGLRKDDCIADVTTETTERISFRRHEGWQRFSLRFTLRQKPEKQKGKSKGQKK